MASKTFNHRANTVMSKVPHTKELSVDTRFFFKAPEGQISAHKRKVQSESTRAGFSQPWKPERGTAGVETQTGTPVFLGYVMEGNFPRSIKNGT